MKQPPSGPYASHDLFRRIASRTAHGVGSPWAFIVAAAVVVGWAVSGPMFHYSDTWQLVINTSTTIVTFLMVFLIQNTQNRDSHALHLKLDELIRTSSQARNHLLEAENFTEEELRDLQEEFRAIAKKKVESRRASGRSPSSPIRNRGARRSPRASLSTDRRER